MIPLLALALLGLIIGIERTLFLHKDQIRAGEFLTGIKNLLRKRRLIEAITLCEETEGPVSNVVKAALLNYNQPEGKMHATVQSTALVEIPNIERRIGSIAAIAKVAPLIGFLGTIISLFQTFRDLHTQGSYANIGTLSGYISQALITSATGITIAVIAYLGHHFLLGRVKSIVHDMEWVGHDIMQFLLRDLPEEDLSEEEPHEPSAL